MYLRYYVYAYLRKDGTPYYIGKGSKRRAWQKHKRSNGSDLRPRDFSKIQIIKENLTQQEAWNLETELISKYKRIIDGGILVNSNFGGEGGIVLPKGSREGKKNPMFGKNNPCSESKRLEIIKTKNQDNLELIKKAIEMLNNGVSTVSTWKNLNLSRTTVIRLKNRTHGIFQIFPELV